MERELLKQINLKGIKSKIFSLKLTGDILLNFCKTCFNLLKDFSGIKKQKKTLLIKYFLTNYEKIFKKRREGLEEGMSRFLSVLSLHKLNGEVELYFQMFYDNINFKVANIFLKYFNQIKQMHPSLYERPNKLLVNVKIDIKNALEIGAHLLKDDFSITNFSNALSKYFESRRSTHNVISGDILANILLAAYQIGSKNSNKQGQKDGGVFLNWDSKDPQMFEIEVEKPQLPIQSSNKVYSNMKAENNSSQDHTLDMNQINYDFMKKEQKKLKLSMHSDKKVAKPKSKKLNSNLIRICSKYVFKEAPYHPALQANPFPHLTKKSNLNYLGYPKMNKFASARNFNIVSGKNPERKADEEETLDEELKFLKEKLNASKKQLEIQKNTWKLVLDQGKDAVKNYREMKSELDILENINDVMLSIVDKNTQQWKELALIKNSGLEELGKYKFLIATLLEDCSKELNKDISDFKFAGNENIKLTEQESQGFDLYSYLNSKSRPSVDDFSYKKSIKLKMSEKVKPKEIINELEHDKKLAEQYDSLIEDLNDFPDEFQEDEQMNGKFSLYD
jgi:hypothetical protein